jgi:hypothetical protein
MNNPMQQQPFLGQKHQCSACSARFYDMGKQPATCPKCHTTVAPPEPRRDWSVAPKTVKPVTLKKEGLLHDLGAMGLQVGEIDTIDALDEDEDVLISLSELEDRETQEANGDTDDDVHEENLMEDMKEYDTILDNADHEEEEAEH